MKAILAITFENYEKGGGGVAKVIIEHQKMFNDSGYEYLCIFPIKKLIIHDNIMLFCYWGLLINGEFKGVYNSNQVKSIFHQINMETPIVSIHIHHLLYNIINMVQDLVDYFADLPIAFFIHDYYTVCRNYNLMKNDRKYCGPGGISYEKCKGCKYYNHLTRITLKENENFITHNIDRLHFFVPSKAAKDVWISYYTKYADKITVLKHDDVKKYSHHFRPALKYSSKIRIGYLGRPAAHKGWNTWLKVIDSIDHDRYECYTFNNTNDQGNNKYQHVYVNVTPENKDAMVKALISNDIDCVLLWSLCPETYSYTYFESYCADEFILTNNISGNIAYECDSHRNGIVLDNENQLITVLNDTEKFIDCINEYRLNHDLIPSEMAPNTGIVGWVKKQESIMENSKLQEIKNVNSSTFLKFLNKYIAKKQMN